MAKRTDYELQIAIGGKVDNSLSKSVSEINGKLDTVGSTVKAVAGIAATAFASIKIKDLFDDTIEASKDMQTSMAGVAKVVDGLKDENGKVTKSYYEMKDSVLDMSEDLPKTAEDIAAIMEAAGQSNIAKNELAEFTEDATKMGIAFDTTAEQAGDWMAAWRTALKLDQSGVVTLADQINYLGNTTSEDALKISDVVTRVGALANTAGISAASVAALSASMTKVAPEVAATGIKNFSLALVSGESATKKQIKTFEELGLEAGNVAKAMQTDSQGTILDVLERINKLDKDKQTSVMKNLFGSESLSSIAPLVANLDNLKEQFNKVGDSALYAGSMEQEYISASSTAANTDILRDNKIKAMQIKIGDTLLPLSTLASETTGNLAKMFGDFAEENTPVINEAVAGITDSFQEFLTDAVYQLKSFAEGGKKFLSGLKPIFNLLEDNPDLIPNFLKSTGGAIVTYKLGKNIGEIVKGAKEAGSPLKLLSSVITNPWALAIGAVAGGVAMFAQSIASANKELRAADLASRFGDISLSLEDLDSMAAELLYNDNFAKLSESLDIRNGLETLRDSIDDSLTEMNKLNWKVKIGLKLTEEEQAAYKNSVINFIADTQQLLDDTQYALNLSLDVLTDNDESGQAIRDSANEFYLENQDALSDLGDQLFTAMQKGFSDKKLTIDEVETISNLQKQMAAITNQLSQSKFEATLEVMQTKTLGTDLTSDSYKNLIAEMQEQSQSTIADYDESLAMNIANSKVRLKAGKINNDQYNEEIAEYKRNYLEDIGDVNLTISNFGTDTIFKAYDDEIEEALPQLSDKISKVVDDNKEILKGLFENDELGRMNTYISDMKEQMQELDSINPEMQKNLLDKYKELLPTKEELEELKQTYIDEKQSYIEQNKEVPETITSSLDTITKSLNEIFMIGAMGGDEQSIYSLIGSKIGEDADYKQLLTKASEAGADVPETLISSLDSKLPDLKSKASEIRSTIEDELESGINADIPVDISLYTKENVPNLFDTNFKELSNNLLNLLPGHKDGGIFNTPHVAWFAEDGPEAAIPLDGSSEAIRLWQMAGQILGMFDLNDEYKSRSISIPNSYQQLVNNASTNSSVTNAPTITIENHITVESGADVDKVKTAINDSYAQFKSYMSRYDKEITRTSMGGR